MFVFLSFLPLFTIVASWIVLIIRTSSVLQHLHHYVTIPSESLLPFFQALAFPFQVTWNAPLSPPSAIASHILSSNV